MFRKTLLGLTAAAALATTVLAPTAASATYYGYGHGHRSYYKPYYNSYSYYQPYCFYKKVWTYYGWEHVKVCR